MFAASFLNLHSYYIYIVPLYESVRSCRPFVLGDHNVVLSHYIPRRSRSNSRDGGETHAKPIESHNRSRGNLEERATAEGRHSFLISTTFLTLLFFSSDLTSRRF